MTGDCRFGRMRFGFNGRAPSPPTPLLVHSRELSFLTVMQTALSPTVPARSKGRAWWSQTESEPLDFLPWLVSHVFGPICHPDMVSLCLCQGRRDLGPNPTPFLRQHQPEQPLRSERAAFAVQTELHDKSLIYLHPILPSRLVPQASAICTPNIRELPLQPLPPNSNLQGTDPGREQVEF